MKGIIQFSNVSKRYRLGMTRKSMPEIISSWVRSAVRQSQIDNGSLYHWALRDVSFELKKGDSLALVGANGAGKTTTLKLLTQITKPTSGVVKVNGTLAALIELGAGFHPDLSGRENIFLNGAIMGLKKSEIERRFDHIVTFAGLEKFIDTPLKRYSSGMTVRLGFSIASSIDPDVLLVDEVLAVGDVSFRLKCMTRMQELLDNGTTLIFVSHNTGLIKSVCKLGMYIEDGQAKYFGTSGQAVDAYNKALNDQRAREFEKENAKPRGNSAIAEITKLEVKGDRDAKAGTLLTNHPAKISIHCLSHQDLGEVSVVLQIIRSDGIGCVKLYSRLDQTEIFLKKGYGEISATFDPLQLVPGRYSAVATLKNKNESYTFDMGYSEWFHVDGDTTGDDDLEAIFLPNHTWHHQTHLEEETLLLQGNQQ